MALTLKDLPLDTRKIGEIPASLVGESRIVYKYRDGVKTDEIEGTTYTGLFPTLNYEKVSVKVIGEIKPSIIYEGKPIQVIFENLDGKAYQDFKHGGEIKLSLTATAISQVETKTLKMNKEVV